MKRPGAARHFGMGFKMAGCRAVPLALLITPIVVYAYFVSTFAVNVPMWDEWDVTVPLVYKLYSGHLKLSDLWAQYYEERMLITNVVTLSIARVTSFDTRAETQGGVILLIASYVLLCAVYRNSRRADGTSSSLWLVLPTAYILFNALPYNVALWGIQIGWYIVAGCLFGLLLALQWAEVRPHAFYAAMFLAIIASLSSFKGLLLWPTGLIYLLMRDRLGGRLALPWILAGAVTAGFYYWGFDFRDTGGPSPILALRHPLATAEFFLSLVGAAVPLIQPHFAEAGGLIIVALCVTIASAWLRSTEHRLDHTLTLALTLITFGLLFDAAVAISRIGFGIDYSIRHAEYTAYNLVLLCGVYFGVAALLGDCRATELGPGITGQTLILLLLGAILAVQIVGSAIVFVLLGSRAVGGEPLVAVRNGLVLLALSFFLAAIWSTRHAYRTFVWWFALAASGAAMYEAVTAPNRPGVSWQAAYAAFALCLWCGLLIGFLPVVADPWRRRTQGASYTSTLARLLLIVMLGIHAADSLVIGVTGATKWRSAAQHAALVLSEYRVASDDDIRHMIYSDAERFHTYASFLEQHELSVFARR